MSKKREKHGTREGRQRVFANQYSRSQGVASYRSRRRVSLAAKIVATIFLLLIVGGAAILFGRQFLYTVTGGDGATQDQGKGAKATSETVEITTVQPESVFVISAGDVILSGGALDSGREEGSEAYNFTHLFNHIEDEVDRGDLRMLSQETAMAGSNYAFGNLGMLNSPQDLGRAEVAAGFNVILHATDHALDIGREGIHNELLWWHDEQPEIPVLGIAEPDQEANPSLSDYVSNVYLYEKNSFKVAVLNHTQGVYEDNQTVVSALTEEKIASDVEQARSLGAEMIIACPHWGYEGSTTPSEEQRSLAQVYANHGVDVIVGTNPRVLQPVEVIEAEDGHRVACFYSLGCLVSSLEGDNLLGGLAEFTLNRMNDGGYSVDGVTLKPVVTNRATGKDYGVYLLSDYADETAQQSWDARLRNSYSERCAEILGDAYDPESCELHLDLNA